MDADAVDLKKLRAFRFVARYGNLRLAAARLNITVPAISVQIRRLEEDLGVKLFQRLPNKLILTRVGEDFVGEVDAIFERVDKALGRLSSQSAPKGRIVFSIGNDIAWYFAPRIATFIKRYPGIDLRMQIYKASEAIAALGKGDLDVGVGVFPMVPKTMVQEVVVESSLSLACPPGHPLLRQQLPRFADIARYKLLVLPHHTHTRQVIDRAFADAGVQTRSFIEAGNCQSARAFAEQGIGIALVHSLCMENSPSKRLRRIDLAQSFPTVQIAAVYRKESGASPVIRQLLDAFAAQDVQRS
jgi:DNA-binding transcriptional LysR family regulator